MSENASSTKPGYDMLDLNMAEIVSEAIEADA
jgi:hypothetical protein